MAKRPADAMSGTNKVIRMGPPPELFESEENLDGDIVLSGSSKKQKKQRKEVDKIVSFL